MTDAELLYRYCMRKGLIFTYSESPQFRSVIFSSDKSGKLFSYTFNKEENRLQNVSIDGTPYTNVETALQDFDDYELLRKNQSLY